MNRTPSTLVCAVTPFKADGSLDREATRSLIERFGQAGIGTYLGSSSPGEGYTLTLREIEELFGVAKDSMSGRAPVCAMGIEPHNAEDLLAIVRIAEQAGLDAMQIYCVDMGHGNTPTDAELESYFRTLLDRMTIPAVLSSHAASGYLIPIDLVELLLNDYPIRGINCTTPDIGYLSRLIEVANGRADVHVGGPMHALTALSLGAQGFLSADGNIAPKAAAAIIDDFASGNIDQAQVSFEFFIRIFRINVWGGSMRWLKAAMEILGLPGSHLRPPYLALGRSEKLRIGQELDALGLREIEGY